jgi:hypothetical protein
MVETTYLQSFGAEFQQYLMKEIDTAAVDYKNGKAIRLTLVFQVTCSKTSFTTLGELERSNIDSMDAKHWLEAHQYSCSKDKV